MFIYLSKKIAIPNNTRVNCLAWSSVEGWLAVGGDDALLKVLKLDSAKDSKGKSLAAPANLSMNQTMEGHSGSVEVITWNDQHQKLTTSDQTGLIIVWTLYKGTWYEEMINNRNKSVVKGMVWNSEGLKICIVYEDGAVIVGSVDGNRIWGKELKGLPLCGVQWSPDSRLLIFALKTGEIHVYDSLGNFITKVVVMCLPSVMMVGVSVVGLAWYDGRCGYQESNCPCLAICFQTGHAQIMRRYNDENAVVIETGFNVAYCCWNHNGSILAIAGTTVLADETKETNIVQFYTPYGEHLRSLKVPGRSISCAVWEGGSLRMALAVDSFIYFAIIRPDYKWCYFSDTVVYSYNKPNQPGTVVSFWHINNPTECNVKCVKSLYGIAACREHCVLAVKADDANGKFCLLLCNSLATTVDSKFMEVEPLFVAMNSSHVFAASKDHFVVWPFMTPKSHSTLGTVGSKYRKERIYHIDDTPSGVAEVILDLDENYQPPLAKQEESGDPVCCICCSDKVLLVGRESGSLQRYSLPQVALVQRYSLSSRPQTLRINSDSTKVAVVETGGGLTLVDLTGGETVVTDRKDVWSLCWARDNPSLMAIMEKTRMYVLKGTEPEEPIMSSAYIASFNELEIRAVLLDEILSDPESPSVENHVLDLEVKSLRDTRQLLDKIGLPEATAFIEHNPHPRLWRLLAEAAVKKLDFETAESAFVRCTDYAGIQLVKRLGSIASEPLQKAQVAAYFGDFNEAERLYLEADRRDLAISLREKLGDWFRVLQLMKSGGGGTDSQYHTAYNSIAHHFAEINNWECAKEYYEKAKNTEKLIKCYQMLEDYDSLEQCAAGLPDKYPLLKDIAEIFLSVGMCSQAVNTFIKCGLVERGVEGCISLSEWDQAVSLAETHSILPHIADRLDQAAAVLLEKGKHFDAIQLYRKANRFLDAAYLMFDLAKEESSKKVKPLRLKKLYVLAALLVEEHNNYRKLNKERSWALLDNYETGMDIKTLDNAWRGAEAYHFLMLAQRQLYEGYHQAAMMTALYLKSYEDILPTEEIYCLLALASCGSNSFGTASKAFMKLESLNNLSEKEKEEYSDLAMDIFTRNVPKDLRVNFITCPTCSININPWSGTCSGCETRYPACIVTGRPVTNLSQAWSCPSCSHPANHSDINIKQNCPLCHSPRLSI